MCIQGAVKLPVGGHSGWRKVGAIMNERRDVFYLQDGFKSLL